MKKNFRKILTGLVSAVTITALVQVNTLSGYAQITSKSAHMGQRLSAPVTRAALAVDEISTVTDFDMFANDYGYQDFSAFDNKKDRRALYQEIARIAGDFWNSSADLNNVYNNLYEIDSVNLAQYNLTFDEVVETYFAFKEDNPIFYYLSNVVYIKGVKLYLYADADYAKASARKQYQESIINGLNEFIRATNGMTTDFDIILEVHDMISDKIQYAYQANGQPSNEAYAHNILGYFDESYGEGVCECYARTYALALNLLGIENVYVTGVAGTEDHVWNIVKLDGSYYYIDCTWDDGGDSYDYFLKGENSVFKTDHFANSNQATGVDYLYPLPKVSDGDYVYETEKTIEIDSVRDFKRIALYPSGNYQLTGDVDFSNIHVNNASIYQYLKFTFDGIINGNGHMVRGLKVGLFETIGREAVIRNLLLEADFSGSAWQDGQNKYGAIKYALAQNNLGLIEKCSVDFSMKDIEGMGTISVMNIGGFVRNNYGIIKNSSAEVKLTGNTSQVEQISLGGMVFNNYGKVDSCEAAIEVKDNDIERLFVGGFCAMSINADSMVSNSKVSGIVTSYGSNSIVFGGIVPENNGIIDGCESNVSCNLTSVYSGGMTGLNHFIVKNCVNQGRIAGNISYLGGVAGYNKGVLERCTNSGSISYGSGSQSVGGITGMTGTTCIISHCENTGAITRQQSGSSEIATGGIVGRVPLNTGSSYDANHNLIVTPGYVFIKDCKNTGSIGGDNNGAIAGIISVANKESQVILKNCTNTGSISGKSKDTLSGATNIHSNAKRTNDISVVLINNTAAAQGIVTERKLSHVNIGENLKIDSAAQNQRVYYSAVNSTYAGGTVKGTSAGNDVLVIYDTNGNFDYELIVVDAEKHTWNEGIVMRGADRTHFGVIEYTSAEGDAIKYEMISEDPDVEDATKVLYGDANQDGVVDTQDGVILKKYLAGYNDIQIDVELCDVDDDGSITSADVVLVAKYLAGYPVAIRR